MTLMHKVIFDPDGGCLIVVTNVKTGDELKEKPKALTLPVRASSVTLSLFQDDGAPAHRERGCTEWLISPDLHSAGRLQEILDAVGQCSQPPATKYQMSESTKVKTLNNFWKLGLPSLQQRELL